MQSAPLSRELFISVAIKRPGLQSSLPTRELPMSRLLSLPLEIRSKILGYVSRTSPRDLNQDTYLIFRRNGPQEKLHMGEVYKMLSFSDCPDHTLEESLCLRNGHWYKLDSTNALHKLQETNLSIRLACRQLYEETKDFLWRDNFITFCQANIQSEDYFPTECYKIHKIQFPLVFMKEIWTRRYENAFLSTTGIVAGCNNLKVLELKIDFDELREYIVAVKDWPISDGGDEFKEMLVALGHFRVKTIEEHDQNLRERGGASTAMFQSLKRNIVLDLVGTRVWMYTYLLRRQLPTIFKKLTLAFGAEFWLNGNLFCVDRVMLLEGKQINDLLSELRRD